MKQSLVIKWINKEANSFGYVADTLIKEGGFRNAMAVNDIKIYHNKGAASRVAQLLSKTKAAEKNEFEVIPIHEVRVAGATFD